MQVVAYKKLEQENQHFSRKIVFVLILALGRERKTLIFLKTLMIVFEYVPLGNLWSLLRFKIPVLLTPPWCAVACLQSTIFNLWGCTRDPKPRYATVPTYFYL